MDENKDRFGFDDEAQDAAARKKIEEVLTPEKLEEMFERKKEKARKLILDPEKFEEFLRKAEEKLKDFPAVGAQLSNIPALIDMLWFYFRGEYTAVPTGTIIAIVIAIAYWLSPIDLIPDCIPVVGMLDDAAVIAGCLKMIGGDLDDFRVWRAAQQEVNE